MMMMNEEKSRKESHGRADYVLFMLTKLRHWCHSNLKCVHPKEVLVRT